MPISQPRLEKLPIEELKASWPRSWATWFTEVWQAVYGWRRTYFGSKTHDFGSINSQSQAVTTVTITGVRATGANVQVTPETPTDGIIVDGYVSAADTVTIRAHNYTAGALDPAQSVYNVIVYQQ